MQIGRNHAAPARLICIGRLAWRGRRLQAKPEPVGSDADGEAEAGIGGDELLPRFGVVPLDSVDKHEEQRILPPI